MGGAGWRLGGEGQWDGIAEKERENSDDDVADYYFSKCVFPCVSIQMLLIPRQQGRAVAAYRVSSRAKLHSRARSQMRRSINNDDDKRKKSSQRRAERLNVPLSVAAPGRRRLHSKKRGGLGRPAEQFGTRLKCIRENEMIK